MARNSYRKKVDRASEVLAKLDEMLRGMGLLQQRLDLLEYRVADLQAMTLQQLGRQILPLDEQFVAVRTPGNWSVIGSEEIRSLIHLAEGTNVHEPGTHNILQRLVDEGDIVLDVGAHVGLLTIPLAARVGPEGKIHAFEPIPRSAEALRRALLLNGLLDRCILHLAAVSNQTGIAHFYSGDNSMMGSLYSGDERTPYTEVPVTTLDDAIMPGTQVSLVKIDAEGAEAAVAAGMQRLVRDNPDVTVMAELGPSHL